MGNKIKDARKNAGLSQQKLAQISGISRATLSGLESGRIQVTTTGTLSRIAKALKMEISDIFFTSEV